MSKSQQWLAASALIPVIGALSRPTHLQALIYTFFVFVYLSPLVFAKSTDENRQGAGEIIPPVLHKGRFFAAVITGAVTSEILLALSLFKADFIIVNSSFFTADLFNHACQYLGVALAWTYINKRWQLKTRQIFFVMFAVSLMVHSLDGDIHGLINTGARDFTAAALTLLTWLVVDGAIIALAFIAAGRVLVFDDKKQTHIDDRADAKMAFFYAWLKCIPVALFVFAALEACGFAALVTIRLAGLGPPGY